MALDFSDKWDFTFADDVKGFSDRLLRIEICDGDPKTKFLYLVKPWIKYDAAEKENALDAHTNSEEQNVNCNMPKELEEAMETSDDDSFESSSTLDSFEASSTVDSFEASSTVDSFEGSSTVDSFEGSSTVGSFEGSSTVGSFEGSSTGDSFEGSSTVDSFEASSIEDSFEGSSTEDSFEGSSTEDSFDESSTKDIDESYSKPTSILCVKSIHINSFILAEKSVFFNELFLNEPRNSEHRDVTIRINVSEEVALMHLLSFIHRNTLSTSTSANGLIQVIMVADKYEVLSCMKYCSKCLLLLKMTPMTAVAYLKLSFIVRMLEGIQPIVDAAKQYLTGYFNNFEKLQELMMLSLVGIEVVLSSDGLQIPNEDTVFEFLIKWVALHYSKPDKRRKIMNTRLSRLMRFHYMSCKTLGNVLACPNFDQSVSSKLVHDALFFQAEPLHSQDALILAGDFSIKRAYTQFLFGMAKFQLPSPRCTVYVDFKMEECIGLSTTKNGVFQVFYLNGEEFYLNMLYNLDPESGYHCFGLVLGTQNKCVGSTPVKVYLIISAMQKPSEKFMFRYNGDFTFDGRTTVGYPDLFAMSWTDLMAEDCVYFIDGSLHLMLEFMIIK